MGGTHTTVISRFERRVSTFHSTKNSNGTYDKVYPVSSRLREHFMTSLALHVIPSSYNKFTPCLQYISGAGTGGGEADRNIPEHDSFPTLFQNCESKGILDIKAIIKFSNRTTS